ncbi:MAG: DsbE family thiol:disulfide interchange protein [Alphaproteobacteria bacterium]
MKYIPFLVLLLISILITSAMLLKKDDNNIQNYIIGTKISEFELPSLYEKDDKFHSKIFHSNGWKVLNVFASWCQQCKSEHKYLKKLSKIIPLYGIAYNDNPIKTKRFLDKMGNVYSSVGIDEHGNNAVLIGISGIPETYLIDGQGIIRFKYLGALDDKVLDDYIIPIIEEKKD